ncbi:hypothetical protein BGZ98_007172 [Dissophora globulifera]|nr:hypothetical protein BGZ98_007172 [Dissophora globulifera]
MTDPRLEGVKLTPLNELTPSFERISVCGYLVQVLKNSQRLCGDHYHLRVVIKDFNMEGAPEVECDLVSDKAQDLPYCVDPAYDLTVTNAICIERQDGQGHRIVAVDQLSGSWFLVHNNKCLVV